MTAAAPKYVELGSPGFWNQLRDDPRALATAVCSVSVVDLEQTMAQHSALRAWVNSAHEGARIEEARKELEDTRARARALLAAKSTLDAMTNKAKIADVLKAEVELDPAVVATADALLDAQQSRGALRAMADALEDRLQMLIQLSARQREELRDNRRN